MMLKKLAALMVIGVMVFGTGATVLANPVPANAGPAGRGICFELGLCPGGGGMRGPGGLMWDEDGNFLSREAFEEKLDALIADGIISAEYRDLFLERHDFCGTYGGGATGIRGNCVDNWREAGGHSRGMMRRGVNRTW